MRFFNESYWAFHVDIIASARHVTIDLMPKYKPIAPKDYDRRGHNIVFKFAVNGIRLAFETQPNFRIHVIFFILMNIAAYVYQISVDEYLILLLMSCIVLVAEMFNTIVEALGDQISGGKYNKLVGVSKDVASGAVLIAALFSIAVGAIIFLPRFLQMLSLLY